MLKVFCRFKFFEDCFEFRKFFSALYLNCDSIVFVWFSIASRCEICNFKMFIIILFPRRSASARCTSSA